MIMTEEIFRSNKAKTNTTVQAEGMSEQVSGSGKGGGRAPLSCPLQDAPSHQAACRAACQMMCQPTYLMSGGAAEATKPSQRRPVWGHSSLLLPIRVFPCNLALPVYKGGQGLLCEDRLVHRSKASSPTSRRTAQRAPLYIYPTLHNPKADMQE